MTDRASAATPSDQGHLSRAEGERLLAIAREALSAHWQGRQPPAEADLCGGPARGLLAAPLGVFVTWKRAGRLRGCIGYITGQAPLWRAVRDLAVTAAVRDTRFDPIGPDEAPGLDCSVSVLTPARPIAPEDVEIGRHGLIVERGHRRGLLLPQVAMEWGYDREAFIARTCEKAGLPHDAWREEGTRLLGFEAQVFGEAEEEAPGGSAGGPGAGAATGAGAGAA